MNTDDPVTWKDIAVYVLKIVQALPTAFYVLLGAFFSPFLIDKITKKKERHRQRGELISATSTYYASIIAYEQVLGSKARFEARWRFARLEYHNVLHSNKTAEEKEYYRANQEDIKKSADTETQKVMTYFDKVSSAETQIRGLLAQLPIYYDESKCVKIRNQFETVFKLSSRRPFNFEWRDLPFERLDEESEDFMQTFRMWEVKKVEEGDRVMNMITATLA